MPGRQNNSTVLVIIDPRVAHFNIFLLFHYIIELPPHTHRLQQEMNYHHTMS